MVMFRKSLLAGIVVSIGAYNYLLNYDILSKILFSVALLVILSLNLNLFTSKVATLCCDTETELSTRLKNMGVIILGNVIACVILGTLFSTLGETHAEKIWAAKMQTALPIALFKAIIVGMLMQVAVLCRHELITIGVVLLFLGTNTEHSIANVVYMSVAGAFSIKAILYIVLCMIGNGIGASIIYLLNKDGKTSSQGVSK